MEGTVPVPRGGHGESGEQAIVLPGRAAGDGMDDMARWPLCRDGIDQRQSGHDGIALHGAGVAARMGRSKAPPCDHAAVASSRAKGINAKAPATIGRGYV